MFRRSIVLASTALITGGCWRRLREHRFLGRRAPPHGWPAQYGDAANSSSRPTAGADQRCGSEWTRSVKGDLAAAVALGSGSYLAVNAQTAGGCSLMVWETDNNGPPTLVHPAGAGRRTLQPAFRRVRQPLHRPARRDDVVPADPVDPVAPAR